MSKHFSKFTAASDALSHLLCSNISHRDLKLENLLLQRPASEHEIPAVKIADFGLAKKMAESQMRTICGTPQYVAPEVILVSRHSMELVTYCRFDGDCMLEHHRYVLRKSMQGAGTMLSRKVWGCLSAAQHQPNPSHVVGQDFQYRAAMECASL